jgi:magnesium chelatase family protein
LPDPAVQESRDLVQAVVRNAGLDFPRVHVKVNLAPAANSGGRIRFQEVVG